MASETKESQLIPATLPLYHCYIKPRPLSSRARAFRFSAPDDQAAKRAAQAMAVKVYGPGAIVRAVVRADRDRILTGRAGDGTSGPGKP